MHLKYPKLTELWNSFASLIPGRPQTFVDMGVGYENSEAWACKSKWPKCRIIGFEACDTVYEKIKSEYPGELLPYAVGESMGTISGFQYKQGGKYVDSWQPAPVSVLKGAQKNAAVEKVVTSVTMDHICTEYKITEPVILWVDIEGGELDMLRGASTVLSSGIISGMCIEIWSKQRYQTHKLKDVVDLLSKYGYNLMKSHWDNDYIFIKE